MSIIRFACHASFDFSAVRLFATCATHSEKVRLACMIVCTIVTFVAKVTFALTCAYDLSQWDVFSCCCTPVPGKQFCVTSPTFKKNCSCAAPGCPPPIHAGKTQPRQHCWHVQNPKTEPKVIMTVSPYPWCTTLPTSIADGKCVTLLRLSLHGAYWCDGTHWLSVCECEFLQVIRVYALIGV